MPSTEQSFADRHGRAETLHALIAGFTPAFAPLDAKITPAGFETYIAALEAANTSVSDKEFALLTHIGNRRVQADDLKETALRVKDHVTSNSAWKSWHTMVTRAANKVRGQVLGKKKTATPPAEGDAGTPAPRARQGARSQQGFHDLEGHFDALIAAVNQVTGYSAAEGSGLELEELETQATTYSQLLKDTSEREAAFTEGVRVRLALYDNKEEGLNMRMKAIKKAVRSQYGAESEEYSSVRTVKV